MICASSPIPCQISFVRRYWLFSLSTKWGKVQFDKWKANAEKVWFEKEFDYLEWFVGLKKIIPANTGYTIGFAMVSEYLKKHPGSSAASLYATPANVFLEK
jgi:uncharacterized protein YjaZ